MHRWIVIRRYWNRLRRIAARGLNHLAFSTPDIFDAVPRLAADGVHFLRIPRNYYDDLVARFGLPDELIDTMHELNILYDHDESARRRVFFHAYTE